MCIRDRSGTLSEKRQGEIFLRNRGTCGQDKKFQARAEEIMKKEKWSKRHSSGFRKWLITVLLAISVLMTGYSVLKETGDVLLDQAKAWMEEGIDGARDEAGDDGDVASDKKCGGTSAADVYKRQRQHTAYCSSPRHLQKRCFPLLRSSFLRMEWCSLRAFLEADFCASTNLLPETHE